MAALPRDLVKEVMYFTVNIMSFGDMGVLLLECANQSLCSRERRSTLAVLSESWLISQFSHTSEVHEQYFSQDHIIILIFLSNIQ